MNWFKTLVNMNNHLCRVGTGLFVLRLKSWFRGFTSDSRKTPSWSSGKKGKSWVAESSFQCIHGGVLLLYSWVIAGQSLLRPWCAGFLKRRFCFLVRYWLQIVVMRKCNLIIFFGRQHGDHFQLWRMLWTRNRVVKPWAGSDWLHEHPWRMLAKARLP